MGQAAEIKAGDVVGFAGRGWLSGLISIACYGIPGWSLSHVGIVADAPDGRLLIFESTGMVDELCAIRGVKFIGCQAHEIKGRVANYDGRVWHYPLYRDLYSFERQRLTSFLMQTIGTPYSIPDALRVAGYGFSWIESFLRPEDLRSIVCSEWVAAAHQHIGVLQTGDASRWNPSHLVRHERLYGILRRPVRLK